MSRRDRRPGPVKYGPLSPTRHAPPGGSGWISVDPTARGEPTSSIPDFSDNNNLPVDGVWYRYDPEGSLNDNPSTAGQYVASSASGLQFWLNRNDANPDALWDYIKNKAGRFVTTLMRPDGRGPIKWDDEFGIEFLLYNPADDPNDLTNQIGLTIGIGTDEILTSSADNAVDGCWLQAYHRGTSTNTGLHGRFGGDHGQQAMATGTNPKVWAHLHVSTFATKDSDADENWAAYTMNARMFKADGRMTDDKTDNETQTIDPDYSADPMTDSKVFLYLAPFSYQVADNTDAGADEVSLANWKVWYRINWNTDSTGGGTAGMNFPSWVGGRVNVYTGVPKPGWDGG